MTYLLDYQNEEKNYKVIKTNVSSADTAGTSWSNVTGSQISYKPESGISKVIYEFNTAFGRKDFDSSVEFRLRIGNTIGEVSNIGSNYYSSFGNTNAASFRGYRFIELRYDLDTSLFGTSGTDEKVIVLQCRAFNGSSSKESYINCTRSPSNIGSSGFLYDPVVICYSL